MPLTIAAIAGLGAWMLGLSPAAAMLLGAALAPTDPVLASDVQVGEPTADPESEDEVRFSLTSEAGLNDSLAFPFTYAATFPAPERLWAVAGLVIALSVVVHGVAATPVMGWVDRKRAQLEEARSEV